MSPAAKASVGTLLEATFTARHVNSAMTHFEAMNAEFQRGSWEEAIAKGGKFVEAVLKALCINTDQPLATGRGFKAGKVIDTLGSGATAGHADAVRLTIPRACRFVYDIASNRGARHDPDEIDPNLMDARAVVATAAWILAEMLRHAQKGALDLTTVSELVDGLTQRQYMLIEHVQERVYFHLPAASAKDIVTLSLWQRYPGRMSRQELIESAKRHRHSGKNATMAVARMAGLVDVSADDRMRLLQPGIKKAEELLARASAPPTQRRRTRRRR
jgi:hypothetical protein